MGGLSISMQISADPQWGLPGKPIEGNVLHRSDLGAVMLHHVNISEAAPAILAMKLR